MGSIVNRGTKATPRWYVTYKDNAGRWRMVNSKQDTRAKALKYLAGLEGRVAQGKVGLEERRREGTFGELADYWLETHSEAKLTSHSDNVSRMQHLRKVFGNKPPSWITAERVDELAARMARETVTG